MGPERGVVSPRRGHLSPVCSCPESASPGPGQDPEVSGTTSPTACSASTAGAPAPGFPSSSDSPAPLEAWWPEVLGSLQTAVTNAGTEAINRTVKTAARTAYGCRNAASDCCCAPSSSRQLRTSATRYEGQCGRLGSCSHLHGLSSPGTAIVRSRSPAGSGREGQVGVVLHQLPGLVGAGNGGGGRRRVAPRVTGGVVRR